MHPHKTQNVRACHIYSVIEWVNLSILKPVHECLGQTSYIDVHVHGDVNTAFGEYDPQCVPKIAVINIPIRENIHQNQLSLYYDNTIGKKVFFTQPPVKDTVFDDAMNIYFHIQVSFIFD